MGEKISSASTYSMDPDSSVSVMEIARITMAITLIFIFLIIIFVLILYLHAYYSWDARASTRRRNRRRNPSHSNLALAAGSTLPSLGLDSAVLLSLPVIIYRPSEFTLGLECAVCLSEISDGEKTRLLPKCNHSFHLECIDMWFCCHSTCPLCRSTVGGEDERPLTDLEHVLEGERTMITISIIPNESTEMFETTMSPSSSGRAEGEEMRSPADEGRSPEISTGSLEKIMSRGNMTCSVSPNVDHIEQVMMESRGVTGEGSSGFFENTNTFTT